MLRPGTGLYFVVLLVLMVIGAMTAIASGIGLTPLAIAIAIFGVPIALTRALAELIAKFAERRLAEPGFWFTIDIAREKRRHGPLRARRLFGHSLGKNDE